MFILLIKMTEQELAIAKKIFNAFGVSPSESDIKYMGENGGTPPSTLLSQTAGHYARDKKLLAADIDDAIKTAKVGAFNAIKNKIGAILKDSDIQEPQDPDARYESYLDALVKGLKEKQTQASQPPAAGNDSKVQELERRLSKLTTELAAKDKEIAGKAAEFDQYRTGVERKEAEAKVNAAAKAIFDNMAFKPGLVENEESKGELMAFLLQRAIGGKSAKVSEKGEVDIYGEGNKHICSLKDALTTAAKSFVIETNTKTTHQAGRATDPPASPAGNPPQLNGVQSEITANLAKILGQ